VGLAAGSTTTTSGDVTRLVPLLLVALLGCAGRGPVTIEEAPGTVVCRRGPDCDEKWRRALVWVRKNSHFDLREASEALIATEGPRDELYPAFTIRRFARAEEPGSDAIVFEAGCSPERVSAGVDHMPPHQPRWSGVRGPKVKRMECTPPVDALETSFLRALGGASRRP